MVCYQENDNIISNRSLTRLEEVLFPTRQQNQQQNQQQRAEEDTTDSMPDLEWDYDVNPAEDNTNEQNDNIQEHMWHYIAEEQNEEFYRRLEERPFDFFALSSFQLPNYISHPNHQEEVQEEEVIEEHQEYRTRYVNRRRPLLSNALYENIANNLFLN